MKFSERMKKWRRKYVEEEDAKRIFPHSTGYHTFFQGYSEEKILAGNAKGYKIERTYTAPYLAFTDDRRKWIGHKILYSALYLAAFALVVLAMFSRAIANYASWVSLFAILQIIAMLLLLVPMLYYVTAPMKMRMGQFNISAKRIGFFSKPAVAFAGLYLLLSVIWYVVYRVTPGEREIVCLILQILDTAAITALCVIESRIKYKRIKNEAADPSREANQIW